MNNDNLKEHGPSKSVVTYAINVKDLPHKLNPEITNSIFNYDKPEA